MLANWGRQGIELIQKLGTVALLFFGAKLVIDGKLTVGELVAFNMLASQVSRTGATACAIGAGLPAGASRRRSVG